MRTAKLQLSAKLGLLRQDPTAPSNWYLDFSSLSKMLGVTMSRLLISISGVRSSGCCARSTRRKGSQHLAQLFVGIFGS
jgi:hypothetical protein